MTSTPPRLLFVCLGNICRSPAAEGVMRMRAEAAGLAIETDSAGTGGWHAGDPPDPRMQAAARERGVDLSALRARKVRAEDFRRFDHVLAMDLQNFAALESVAPRDATATLSLMRDHAPGPSGREVPDPYYGGPDGFPVVLEMLEAACDGLIETLMRTRVRG